MLDACLQKQYSCVEFIFEVGKLRQNKQRKKKIECLISVLMLSASQKGFILHFIRILKDIFHR